MSMPLPAAPAAPRRPSRFRLGVGLLALAFLPAGLAGLTPALWAAIPQPAQWLFYAISGVCAVVIGALIITGEDDAQETPGDATSGDG
ncbi:MAG TPA: hypothetical protein VFS40_00615 [Gemmatimonadales bacterium]|nr:hypothetical protein [Gemmatimonadales bacterium]